MGSVVFLQSPTQYFIMNSFVAMSLLLACLCLTTVTAEHYGSAKGYGSAGYGHGAPSLPPFGAAASHPKYGHGYGGHGSHDYVIARRYPLSFPPQLNQLMTGADSLF